MKFDLEKIANSFENYVNSFNSDYSELFFVIIALNASIQRKFTQVLLTWIDYIGSAEHFDGRNEGAVKAAKYMKTIAAVEALGSLLEVEAAEQKFEPGTLMVLGYDHFKGIDLGFLAEEFNPVIIAQHAGRFHRTLQQSFTRLAFAWLEFAKDNRRADKEVRELAEKLVTEFAQGKIATSDYATDKLDFHYPSKYLGFI